MFAVEVCVEGCVLVGVLLEQVYEDALKCVGGTEDWVTCHCVGDLFAFDAVLLVSVHKRGGEGIPPMHIIQSLGIIGVEG